MTIIRIPEWGPVTLIEALWTATGVGCLAVCLPSLRQAYRDWRAAGRRDEIVRILAFGYLRRELFRVGQGCFILAVGVVADYQTSPGPSVITPVGLVLTGCLFGIGVFVGLTSYFDRRQRTHVAALLRHSNP